MRLHVYEHQVVVELEKADVDRAESLEEDILPVVRDRRPDEVVLYLRADGVLGPVVDRLTTVLHTTGVPVRVSL
jgi:hypothetical protein